MLSEKAGYAAELLWQSFGGALAELSAKSVLRHPEISLVAVEHELQNLEVDFEDALPFLNHEEFIDFFQAYDLGTHRLDQLSVKVPVGSQYYDALKSRKGQFLVKMAFEIRKRELLRETRRFAPRRSELSYSESVKALDNFKSGLSKTMIKELAPTRLKSFNDSVFAVICKNFSERITIQLPESLKCNARWWYFPAPTFDYRQKEVDCLTVNTHLYAVADVKVRIDSFSIAGIRHVIENKDAVLGYYTEVISPKDFEPESFPVLTLPLVLLKGLAEGRTEPEGCTVVESTRDFATFRVQGYQADVKLSTPQLTFFDWSGRGGWDGLVAHLSDLGALDARTRQIIDAKAKLPLSKRVNPSVSAIVSLSVRDADRLRKASKVDEPLSYGQWRLVLNLGSRQGAKDWLKRMESSGYLELEKTEDGTKATLTQLADQALRGIHPDKN